MNEDHSTSLSDSKGSDSNKIIYFPSCHGIDGAFRIAKWTGNVHHLLGVTGVVLRRSCGRPLSEYSVLVVQISTPVTDAAFTV